MTGPGRSATASATRHTRGMAQSGSPRSDSHQPHGVVFPEVNGRRSTSALGRAVVADALRGVDPVGAQAAERETNWRQGYLTHFKRLVEAGLLRDGEAAVDVARAGLDSLHARMRATAASGEVPLGEVFAAGAGAALDTATVRGTGERATEL